MILTSTRPRVIIHLERHIGVVMLIGLIHTNIRRGRAATCRSCKQPIEPGDLHAMVVTRWGKAQVAARNLSMASGRIVTKKTGLKYRRLHLSKCLLDWLVITQTHKREYRREHQGRPQGTSQLPAMTSEERATRRRLVRRRAEVFRQILASEDELRLRTLVGRFVGLEKQLAIPVMEGMARRDSRLIGRLNEKIRRYMNDFMP